MSGNKGFKSKKETARKAPGLAFFSGMALGPPAHKILQAPNKSLSDCSPLAKPHLRGTGPTPGLSAKSIPLPTCAKIILETPAQAFSNWFISRKTGGERLNLPGRKKNLNN